MSSKDKDTSQEPYHLVIDGFSAGATPKKSRKKGTAGPAKTITQVEDIGRNRYVPAEEQTIVQKTFDGQRQLLEKASSQIVGDTDFNYGDKGVVEPPFNLRALVSLNDMSVVRKACINAIATNVARLGYRIKKTDPGAEEQDTDEVSEQMIDFLEKWARQDKSSFSDLIYKIKYDEESCGNAYMEVVRDKEWNVAGLHHVPGHTVLIKRDKSGFIQKVGTKEVPFYNYGDKVITAADGTHKLKEDRNKEIRELIHFRLYSPGSYFYGVPRDVAAITTMYGDELARNHNTKFFTHSATPDLMMVFEVDKEAIPQHLGAGGVKVTMPEATKKEIENYFRRSLTNSTFKPGIFFLPPGVKLKIERMSTEQKDAGWINYRRENRLEVQIAFQTPGVVIANPGEGSSYGTAMSEKSLYLESVVQPEQVRYQQDLMAYLWPEMVKVKPPEEKVIVDEEGDTTKPKKIDIRPKSGAPGVNPHVWKLEFLRMSIADQATLAQINNIYGTLQVFTINEIRASLGMKPIEGGDKPPTPPGDQEGNTLAQNADMNQVAAGNADMDQFVSNKFQHPEDIKFGAGRPRNRGAAGNVSVPMPRRVGEVGIPQAANLFTAGHPMAKAAPEEETVVMTKEAYDFLHEELRKARSNEPAQEPEAEE